MNRAVCVAVFALSLACGGGAATPEGIDLSGLAGRYCEEDPEVGCYVFHADGTVDEEEVELKSGWKLADKGTWKWDAGLLVMRFSNGGTWTLEPLKYTGEVLIVKDWSQDDTFTFVRSQ